MTSTTAFFDHILAQIEAGHASEAIARLAGMLDHRSGEGDIATLRRALIAHPLFDLLCHEPATAIAQRGAPDRIDRLVGAMLDTAAASTGDLSAQMLAAAVGGGALYRAIRARVGHAGEMLARAWREGRSIAILGDTFHAELNGLAARDLGNVTVADADPARMAVIRAALDPSTTVHQLTPATFLAAATRAGDRFDLLYLPRLAETTATPDLAVLFARAAPLLSATGSIVLPAFSADRIGRGWQRACLDWDVQEHDEAALAAAARRAALSSRIFQDAAGCFQWCILSRPDAPVGREGKDDGR